AAGTTSRLPLAVPPPNRGKRSSKQLGQGRRINGLVAGPGSASGPGPAGGAWNNGMAGPGPNAKRARVEPLEAKPEGEAMEASVVGPSGREQAWADTGAGKAAGVSGRGGFPETFMDLDDFDEDIPDDEDEEVPHFTCVSSAEAPWV
ncbi:hypothetical protein CYMTET_35952, partial [Cymbomonas tetramitiformis]